MLFLTFIAFDDNLDYSQEKPRLLPLESLLCVTNDHVVFSSSIWISLSLVVMVTCLLLMNIELRKESLVYT